jgi:hypothetical protein
MKNVTSNSGKPPKKSKLSILDIAKRLENRELFPEKKARGAKALRTLNT